MVCYFSGLLGPRDHLGALVNSKAGDLCHYPLEPETPGYYF